MKKVIYCFIFFILFLTQSTSIFASRPKYTMKERFGVGSDGGEAMKLLGNGWYFDWAYTGGNRANNNIEYMGLLAAGYTDGTGLHPAEQAPDTPESATCIKYKDYITTQGKQIYPDNMRWTIGNEIGWGDGRRSANQYANEFIKWYTCLKSINPTFQVGSGALVALDHQIPDHGGSCATNTSDSGRQFFTDYINEIKRIDSSKLPDLFVNHAYTYCRTGGITVDNFKAEINEQRQLMKELGLQNKDLIIKEWADFSDNSVNYLNGTVSYLLSARDQNIGNPDDDYRLVQKWAWFIFVNTDDIPVWKNAWLYNSHTSDLTALGYAYKSLIKTCSVSLSSNSISPNQSVIISSSGNGGTIRNLISRTDTDDISGLGDPTWTDNLGHKYYIVFNPTVTGLTEGTYKVWCDVPDDPGKCSGNPFCSSLDSAQCAGWGSCSNNDSTTLNVGNSSLTPSSTPPPSSTQSPKPTGILGNIDGIGIVDYSDYYLFTSYFGQTGSPGFTPSDIDKNGVVDLFDYNILVGNWGK